MMAGGAKGGDGGGDGGGGDDDNNNQSIRYDVTESNVEIYQLGKLKRYLTLVNLMMQVLHDATLCSTHYALRCRRSVL